MKVRYLTKIEVTLPITKLTLKVFPVLIANFVGATGIGGCTFTAPTRPSPIQGQWFNPKTKKPDETQDVVLVYACCDLEKHPSVEDTIKFIKETIEARGCEDLAWITYSSVCQPDSKLCSE